MEASKALVMIKLQTQKEFPVYIAFNKASECFQMVSVIYDPK